MPSSLLQIELNIFPDFHPQIGITQIGSVIATIGEARSDTNLLLPARSAYGVRVCVATIIHGIILISFFHALSFPLGINIMIPCMFLFMQAKVIWSAYIYINQREHGDVYTEQQAVFIGACTKCSKQCVLRKGNRKKLSSRRKVRRTEAKLGLDMWIHLQNNNHPIVHQMNY